VYGVAVSNAQDWPSQKTNVQTESVGRQSIFERRYSENADQEAEKTQLGQPEVRFGTTEQWQGNDCVRPRRRTQSSRTQHCVGEKWTVQGFAWHENKMC